MERPVPTGVHIVPPATIKGSGLNITGRHDTAIAPTWEPLSVDLESILTHEKPTGCFQTLYHFHDTLKTLQAASIAARQFDITVR